MINGVSQSSPLYCTCSKSEVGFVMKAVGTDVTTDSSLSARLSHDEPDALSSSSNISVKVNSHTPWAIKNVPLYFGL